MTKTTGMMSLPLSLHDDYSLSKKITTLLSVDQTSIEPENKNKNKNSTIDTYWKIEYLLVNFPSWFQVYTHLHHLLHINKFNQKCTLTGNHKKKMAHLPKLSAVESDSWVEIVKELYQLCIILSEARHKQLCVCSNCKARIDINY